MVSGKIPLKRVVLTPKGRSQTRPPGSNSVQFGHPSMSIEDLLKQVVAFRDARDWKQFHNPKDCAISLSLEASEVLEHFQWKNKEEIEAHIQSHKEDVGEELADVLYWVLLLSHDLEIDVAKSFEKKMEKNAARYPVEKAKGKHTKYNQL